VKNSRTANDFRVFAKPWPQSDIARGRQERSGAGNCDE
jgi:hypothetical protein